MTAKRAKRSTGQVETQADVATGVVVRPRQPGIPQLVMAPRRSAPEIIVAVRHDDGTEQDG